MFSKFFIEHPRFAAVISIAIVLAGALSLRHLPVAEYPEVAPPSIIVWCNYPGASAAEVMETVAMPLEKELNGIEDMIYFSSKCDNAGAYACFLTFKSGTNDDIAMVNVQNAVKRGETKLPAEVRSMGITVRKRSSDILTVYTFMTDGTSMSGPELNNYVGTKIVDALSRVDGIAEASVLGAQVYSMRIWLDPIRMAGLGITTRDIADAVSAQNVQAAAGSIGSEEAGEYIQYKLNVKGRLKTADEFSEIILRSDEKGNLLRLRDVARIELGAEGYSANATFNGKEAVSVAIYRNSDANALATVRRANATIKSFENRFKAGVTWDTAYDPTEFIVISMKEIVETLIIALVLVVLITYAFMQDWRATLVPTLAIPVSLMGTFPIMVMMGLSINVLTMFGLVLVIGSLVDDAIVVVENTQSLIEREKLSSHDAAIKSMQQITGAIIATTLVTIACYMPLAFYGGMVGNIYKQFAWTMCISLTLSTFVAMTLSPAVCALIMRPPSEHPSIVFKPFNTVLDAGRNVYLFCVKKLVRQGFITLVLLAATLFGIWLVSKKVPSSFIPTEDKGALMCHIELSPGATIGRTKQVMYQIQERLRQENGIKDIMAISGFSMLSGESENCAMFFCSLEHWDSRKTPDTQLEPLKRKVESILADFPEISALVFTPPAIMGLGMTNAASVQLCNDGTGNEMDIDKEVKRLLGELNGRSEVQYAMSTYSANTPQIVADIDREKAESLGLTANDIFSALQSQLASFYINDFNFEGETFHVKMQSERENRITLDDVRDIQIQNRFSQMVPLSAVATFRFIIGPRRIERFNKALSAEIQVVGQQGYSTGEIISMLETLNLSPGYYLEWSDMSYQERENRGQIVSLVALAMLFAYLFLVAQYESWTIPVPVMLTVFTALLGSFLGLYYTGESLSIYAQLGLVMLIGLTGKNAILMVEFSKQEREAGKDIYTSAINGASLRFRAVLMTAWSFIFGVFPLVIASGAGAGSRRAIGISTFYGMLLATFFGIIMTPALYAVFQRIRECLKRLFGMKITENASKPTGSGSL